MWLLMLKKTTNLRFSQIKTLLLVPVYVVPYLNYILTFFNSEKLAFNVPWSNNFPVLNLVDDFPIPSKFMQISFL